MLRFRRYRVYVFCAAVVLLVLLHVSHRDTLDGAASPYLDYTRGRERPKGKQQPGTERVQRSPVEVQKPVGHVPEPAAKDEVKVAPKPATSTKQAAPTPRKKHTELPKIPQLKTDLEAEGNFAPPIPTPTIIPYKDTEEPEEVYPTAAAAVAGSDNGKPDTPAVLLSSQVSESTTTIIAHWTKQAEHFPIPAESIIPLPTAKAKAIPRIQHKFEPEMDEVKQKREARQQKVKKEMKRAWEGYRKYAWGHDELLPVSNKFRDPFCGWAATMVDSLDTLWIMDMKEEFNDAYAGLQKIDFTTSPYRAQIPVFETTIRYLGGLLAAYDVSGGAKGDYPLLLTKAVELAEILMGAFDTPNRMPTLHYNWDPIYNSRPRQASKTSNLAEIGSLSMEFTRLAQLTGENKYYDAVARITDALEEYQHRGTALGGIFPEAIDASGCNTTVPGPPSVAHAGAGVRAQGPLPHSQGYTGADSISGETEEEDDLAPVAEADFESNVASGSEEPGESATGAFNKRDTVSLSHNVADVGDSEKTSTTSVKPENSSPYKIPQRFPLSPLTPDDDPARFECVPKGFTSGGWGRGSFSMGGSQDSTYEYFPKQYLLLGGLVEKYRIMHKNVIDSVVKHLLYRPMIESERDILFSAHAHAIEGAKTDDIMRTYEVTHLTCFLGGMFAMGGRMFDRPEDVEIGAKLADGCVWAYEVMPLGVMPEGAIVLPCESTTDCAWNETAWHSKLDPSSEWRTYQLQQYQVDLAAWKAKKEAHAERSRQSQGKKKTTKKSKLKDVDDSAKVALDGSAKSSDLGEETVLRDNSTATAPNVGIAKRSLPTEADDDDDDVKEQKGEGKNSAEVVMLQNKVKELEEQLKLEQGGRTSYITTEEEEEEEVVVEEEEDILPPEPIKPISHEQYVQNRISSENLPPGFVSLNDKRYILRPEAIESVWYMYRITGDPKWQDKGWDMFTSIIEATQTESGHSAIRDVTNVNVTTTEAGSGQLLDNMESFWTAETLKYFYLLYSTPETISLDEWVLNTEAHPFKRPT